MAYELPTNTQAPEALPTAAPSGTPPGMSSSVPVNRALPQPPPGYVPGPTAPIRHAYEDSGLYKVLNTLSMFDPHGGGLPAGLRIKVAQQNADMQLEENKRAWDSYYLNIEATRGHLQTQNRAAQMSALKLYPFMKAQMSMETDPDKRKALADHWGTTLESLSPGSGKFAQYAHDNLATVLSGDDLLSDPKSGPKAQQMVQLMGYENWIMSKEHEKLAETTNHDRVSTGQLYFPAPQTAKLAAVRSGGSRMPEDTFRTELQTAMRTQGERETSVQAAMEYLGTPAGQNHMYGLGVSVDAFEAKRDMKPLTGNPMNAEKFKRFKVNEFQIAHADELGLDEEDVQGLKDENQTLLTIKAKESSPSQNPGSIAGMTMLDLSKGKYQTSEEMLKKTKDGSPERTQGLEWAYKANQAQQNAGPQAQLNKQMGTPVDMSKVDMYSRKDIRAGKVSKLSVPMSEREKRTNADMIELDPKIVTSLTKLSIAKEQGNTEMFDLAAKSFKGKSPAELSAQWGKWKALDIGGPAAAVIASDPKNSDLVAYHDTYTAWAGKDARALGDEVGTMTDADRLVWKDTFPKPVDTPAIQKQKRAIFNRMIDLIYDINARVATGEDAQTVMSDKKIVDRKNGIFGSARSLVNKPEERSTVQSMAEPSTAEAASTRGESLLERMRKGK